jgi:NADH-quinone oxidoreductase subunit C
VDSIRIQARSRGVVVTEKTKKIAEAVRTQYPEAVDAVYEDGRGVVLTVKSSEILKVLKTLRDDLDIRFDLLADEIGVDWLTWQDATDLPPKPGRFSVYYNLYSMSAKERIFVEIFVDEEVSVPSAVSLYGSANWAERIIYDLFGVNFENHPDMRRIYMTPDYKYHPMRKDFPCVGINPQDYPQE